MQFALLIHDEEAKQLRPGDPGFGEMMAAYQTFTESVQKAGAMRAAGRFKPTSEAVTVRVLGGKAERTKGPSAATKEQLGGFYLLECKDLEEALGYAAQIPTAKRGCVEVRPLY